MNFTSRSAGEGGSGGFNFNATLLALSDEKKTTSGGLFGVAVGFTLQVVAQKHAIASHAAIILSLEAVFAAIAGALLLGEALALKGYMGCALMFAGMLLAQLWPKKSLPH